jgi:hypothetical protein
MVEMSDGALIVRNVDDADQLMKMIRGAAESVRKWIAKQNGDPLAMLRRMKFDPVGFHPVLGHALNLVEQINQTWKYCVAAAAARQLMLLHPEVEGFRLAPGAYACQGRSRLS